MIRFLCTNCRQTLAVDAQHVGKPARCTHCQQLVTVPPAPPVVAAPSPGGLVVSIKQPAVSPRPNLTSQLTCPSCGGWLEVNDDQLGQLVPCPTCGRKVHTLTPGSSSPPPPLSEREQRLRWQGYLWILGGGMLGILFGTSIGVNAGTNIGGAGRALIGIILGCGMGAGFVALWAFRLNAMQRMGGWLVGGTIGGAVLGAAVLSSSDLRAGALGGALIGAILGTAAGYAGSSIWRRLDSRSH